MMCLIFTIIWGKNSKYKLIENNVKYNYNNIRYLTTIHQIKSFNVENFFLFCIWYLHCVQYSSYNLLKEQVYIMYTLFYSRFLLAYQEVKQENVYNFIKIILYTFCFLNSYWVCIKSAISKEKQIVVFVVLRRSCRLSTPLGVAMLPKNIVYWVPKGI